MIVDNKGLRYVDGYKECIIHSDANVPTMSGSFNYQWKIPYENNSICTIFNSCVLYYYINITASFNTTNHYTLSESGIELKLNETYKTESFNDGINLAAISFKLTKNDFDGNFIIEISSYGQDSTTINIVVADVSIKYQSDLYDLQVENNQINIGKDLSVRGDVSIGGSLTIPSDKGIEIGELTGGSINIGAMTGGKVSIGNLSSGNVYIDKLGYYLNPINITYYNNIPYAVKKDSFQPHVFYRIKYRATGASNFNNAVIMFETRNSLSSGVNIGGTWGSADHILIAVFMNSSGALCKWDDCSYITFLATEGLSKIALISEIMEVNLIPLHISFATMFEQ